MVDYPKWELGHEQTPRLAIAPKRPTDFWMSLDQFEGVGDLVQQFTTEATALLLVEAYSLGQFS